MVGLKCILNIQEKEIEAIMNGSVGMTVKGSVHVTIEKKTVRDG